MMKPKTPHHRQEGFTLIELLITVAIIAILAMIGTTNLSDTMRRAERVRCVGNLKSIASALTLYRLDLGSYPLADGEAGKHHSQAKTSYGDGPAGNGFWSAVPNALVDLEYLSHREILFCPSLKQTHFERRENLRYAYNAAALDTGGFAGGGRIDGPGMTGRRVWLVRCLHINARGFSPSRHIPFPHGGAVEPGRGYWGEENVLWNDFSVSLEKGRAP